MWQDDMGGGEGTPTKIANRGGSKRYHVRRTLAQIKVTSGSGAADSKPIEARLLLIDFRPDRIEVFTRVPLPLGHEVAITISDPKQFYCKGRVVSKIETIAMGTSRIMPASEFRFRMGIKFQFASASESQSVAKYYEETFREFVIGNTPAGLSSPTASSGNVMTAESIADTLAADVDSGEDADEAAA